MQITFWCYRCKTIEKRMELEASFELEHLLFKQRKCKMCGETKELINDFYKKFLKKNLTIKALDVTHDLYLHNIISCNRYPNEPPHTKPNVKYVILYNFNAKYPPENPDMAIKNNRKIIIKLLTRLLFPISFILLLI